MIGAATVAYLLGSTSMFLRFLRARSLGLFSRLAGLAVVFALELLVFSALIDTHALRGSGGLSGTLYLWVAPMASALVGMATTFVAFAYLRSGESLYPVVAELAQIPVSSGLVAGHLCAISMFGLTSAVLFGGSSANGRGDFLPAIWLSSGALAIVLGGFAVLPPRFLIQIMHKTGVMWAYASAVGLLAATFDAYGLLLWRPSTALTFGLVRAILRPFLSNVTADSAQHIIGTAKFSVEIGATCSGIEGVGLMLVFGILWLWFFRRTCRFPQALLLVPAGMIVVWVLNGLRIALLILIGEAGWRNVAVGGFHSQAGWIAFNGVALGFSVAARRIPGLVAEGNADGSREAESGDTNAAYLVPFLAVLVAAVISRAASAQFEWLYPLRFFAAAAALWYYRSEYARVDWSFDWISVVTGIAAFLLWVALDRLLIGRGANTAAGVALASASGSARIAWIAIRVIAAVSTVPIVEELAFRGFLIRRIVSPAFLSVDLKSVTLLPVLVSSIAFGVLHGDRWLAGTIAGLLYALAFLRRGKLGDAVAAHATTNALLAAYIVVCGKWWLW